MELESNLHINYTYFKNMKAFKTEMKNQWHEYYSCLPVDAWNYHYGVESFLIYFLCRTFEEFKCRKAWKMTVGLPIVREDRRVASKSLYMFLPETYIYICREMDQLLMGLRFRSLILLFWREFLRIFLFRCIICIKLFYYATKVYMLLICMYTMHAVIFKE